MALLPRWQPAWPSASLALAALQAALLVATTPVHAGLFDDEEARKAIVELRSRVAQVDESGKARLAELSSANAQLLDQLTALRRSLLDLNNQLEAVRTEFASLRGSHEQLAKALSDVQRRQMDLGQSVDDRLRKVEPVKVNLDGRDFMVEPDEKRAYEEAVASIRSGDFDKTVALLAAFQRRYPNSPYSDAARFWMGNALYGKRDYKEAITSFRAFVGASPQHPRAPEALLALANSQAETKAPRGARKTIEELMKSYPQSEAAQAGKERLASLK